MSTLQSEVFEALRAIDIPEDKALKAAAALSRRDEDVTSLRSDLAAVRTELKSDIAELRAYADQRFIRLDGEMRLLRWMVGTLYPLVLAILVKLFLH